MRHLSGIVFISGSEHEKRTISRDSTIAVGVLTMFLSQCTTTMTLHLYSGKIWMLLQVMVEQDEDPNADTHRRQEIRVQKAYVFIFHALLCPSHT